MWGLVGFWCVCSYAVRMVVVVLCRYLGGWRQDKPVSWGHPIIGLGLINPIQGILWMP